MFIKRTTRRVGRTTYVNHLLVESVATPQGPRHRTICSLGSLAPAPEDHWRGLAQKLSAALGWQTTQVPDPADRKSTRLNSSHSAKSRMPSSA